MIKLSQIFDFLMPRLFLGGGGGPTSSTVTQSNIPDWLKPQVQGMLGAATRSLFEHTQTGTDPDTGQPIYQIGDPKPYTPYSQRGEDYVAQMTGPQQQAFNIANWLSSSSGGLDFINQQYGRAADFAQRGGYGAQDIAGTAGYYGGQGAGYGSQAANLAGGAAGLGGLYERMATSPQEYQRYMSPYIQNVIAQQQEGAVRQADIASQQRGAAAARSGAFGGARQAIENAEANRALQSQLQNIEATGLQNAYQQAQGNILNRAELEAKGLGQAGQLYGVGMQGAGLGLQGGQLGLGAYGQMGQAGTQLADITGNRLAQYGNVINTTFGLGEQERQLRQQALNQQIQNFAMAQEYPYQRLAAYSALLRGYATPGQTMTQYQAAPSGISQLAGLGTAGLGLAGMMSGAGKKAGGMIEAGDGIDKLALNRALQGG